MTTYDQITIHNAANDDSVMQSLNNFALMLNYGEWYPYENLHEVKMILNQAYLDHTKLLEILAAYKTTNPENNLE